MSIRYVLSQFSGTLVGVALLHLCFFVLLTSVAGVLAMIAHRQVNQTALLLHISFIMQPIGILVLIASIIVRSIFLSAIAYGHVIVATIGDVATGYVALVMLSAVMVMMLQTRFQIQTSSHTALHVRWASIIGAVVATIGSILYLVSAATVYAGLIFSIPNAFIVISCIIANFPFRPYYASSQGSVRHPWPAVSSPSCHTLASRSTLE
eukprot:TRINITY_DN1532_c0_g2_i3.p1 TRINITY_DN1532_c0_g2~~TRINITY_DN1532_c0_g2_i3.p1  ORF type:complete len:208 (+),score=5.01 TRINITY_DN1532_c0_g2_i3:176-799(+)